MAIAGATTLIRPSAVWTRQPVEADDASIAVRLLSRYHPGLLRYQHGRQWAAEVDRFAKDWRTADTLGRKFLLLSELTASIRCGHTHCNPYNQPEIVETLMQGANLLPFHFDWLGDRIIATADPHGSGLEPGTEILAIDGVSASEHLAGLLPLARADGSLDNKRRAILSVTGAKYEFYDMVAAARGQYGQSIALSVKAPGGSSRDVSVDAIDVAARRSVMPGAPERGSDEPLWSARRDGSLGILTMPTWAVFNSAWDWKSWLEAQFDEWARGGFDRLIIDLRGNEGGLTEPGAVIASRLARQPVRPPAVRQLYRVSRVAEEDRQYLETYDDSLYEAGSIGTKVAEGWYSLPSEFTPSIQPQGKRFAGKVAVLCDATNSSATGSFAELVKRERLGTLIGQQTGKNQRGLNGTAYFFARLPESGLEFDLPLVAGITAGDPPDAGTMPDIVVEKTPESIASGGDPELAAARASLA